MSLGSAISGPSGSRWFASCAPARCRLLPHVAPIRPGTIVSSAPSSPGSIARPRCIPIRPSAASPPQPRRVRERHPRSARARRRRRVAAAGRRLGFGFDNIADVLGVSPVLLERYLAAAERISALAVGDRDVGAGIGQLTACARICRRTSTSTACRSARVGGTLVALHVPARRRVRCSRSKLFRTNLDAMRGLEYRAPARDHRRRPARASRALSAATPNPPPRARTRRRPATMHRRAAAGARAGEGRSATRRRRVRAEVAGAGRRGACSRMLRSSRRHRSTSPGYPHLQTADDHRAVQPDRRRRHAEPPADLRLPAARAAPTRRRARATILADARAPRVSPAGHRRRHAAAARRSMRTAAATAAFDDGIQLALQRHAGAARSSCSASSAIRPASLPGVPYRVSDLELASRLSFFLWSSIPDDDAAVAGGAGQAARSGRARRAGAAHARRSAGARRSSSNFAGQWLQLRNLRNMAPNSNEFPDFDDNLRQAFQRETELFFDSIVREDRSVLDLLDGGLHVRERAARQALRHPERLRQPVPPRAR